MSLEIELKFQVPPARLAGLRQAIEAGGDRTGSRRNRLAARYFDTDDQRLAQGRAALRLRHEGEGAGWVQTFKAEGERALQRLEHAVPVPAAGGPGDLPAGSLPEPARHAGHAAGARLDRLLAGARLTEQYRTDIVRLTRRITHQGAVLELALDEGEIVAGDQRLAVCELEIELIDGPAAALLDAAAQWARDHGLWLDVRSKSERGHQLAAAARALAKGLPAPLVEHRNRPAPRLPAATAPAAALRAWLGHALEPALAHAAVLAADAPATLAARHLHPLRVALRRLRVLLQVFGSVLPSGSADAASAGLATLFRGLGRARDADVFAQTLAPALRAAGAPPAALPGPDAVPAVGERLRSAEVQALWLALLRLVWAEAPPAPAGAASAPRAAHATAATPAAAASALAPLLAKLDRRVRRGAARVDQLDEEGLHRLRRRIKRLRYALDASAALWPAKPLRRRLARLDAAREALGRVTDLMAAADAARLRVPQAPEAWFVVGWTTARLDEAKQAAAKPLRRLARSKPWRGRR